LHTLGQTGEGESHAPEDHAIDWIPVERQQGKAHNGLVRLDWKGHRLLIATDCTFSDAAMESLATHDLRADVLIVPGRLGPPERPAQARYHDLLRALIAAAQPELIVLCDGGPSSFAATLAICRTASRATMLSTRLTGALTFTVTPDRNLAITPYHRNTEPIRLSPRPTPHESLQPSALDIKPRHSADRPVNSPFLGPVLTTRNAATNHSARV
jgi:hypothetical protein